MTGPAGQDLPEIGPYLGRLAEATRRFEDPLVGLDQVRLDLVSDLFERVGAARGFLATGDVAGARAALDRATWTAAWQTAAQAATTRTLASIESRFRHAAARSRFPARRLGALLPTEEDRVVLGARLEAAGIPLEERLGRGFPSGGDWREGLRQAAVALEDAWEALEAEVRAELAQAAPRIAGVEGWRPPRTGWYAALGTAAVAAGWLGLVVGGWLPRPAWLDRFTEWFWSLPWP